MSKTVAIKDEFIRMLEQSFKGGRKRKKLVRWIEEHSEELSSLISRGEFLRLKYSTRGDIREVLDSLRPCPVCAALKHSAYFSDHDEYDEANRKIEGAVESGSLCIIEQPSWYPEGEVEIEGGGMFYECLKCGAVFITHFPEREFSGSITRIG